MIELYAQLQTLSIEEKVTLSDELVQLAFAEKDDALRQRPVACDPESPQSPKFLCVSVSLC
jgi:hypothetical protein